MIKWMSSIVQGALGSDHVAKLVDIAQAGG